jgi:uncharacterized protein YunC (DUF1805 family)
LSNWGGCGDNSRVGKTEDAAVIKMEPIQLDGGVAIGVMVELPQTRQLTISTSKGYIAAGYMDLPFLQQRRPERNIIAARVLDVREITDLLAARVHDCTPAAAERGVVAGMTGREALERMF